MAKTDYPIPIGNAEKNKTEVIVVAINEYKGRKFIDARVNFRDKDDPTRLIPTKKGLTLSTKTFEPVMKLFLEAYTKLQEITPEPKETTEDEVPEP